MSAAPRARISGPRAWRAVELAGSSDWIFAGPADLASRTPEQLNRWLEPLLRELHTGTGVALVRGLGMLAEAELRGLFLAIGRRIGRPDTTYGELYEVTDTGGCHRRQAIPVSQTHDTTTVHTDSSRRDTHPRWIGLACIRPAARGGGSRLVSAIAVHDHLAAHHPQDLARLRREFHRDIVTPGGVRDQRALAANRFPIYSQAADGPTLRYMRQWIETGQERLGLPLGPEDRQALDRLDASLNDPTFLHSFRMERGDLLFIDNHKVAHDREAYEDDPAAPRLMVRLWLNNPVAEPGPP